MSFRIPVPEMACAIVAGQFMEKFANMAGVEVLAPEHTDDLLPEGDALIDAEGDGYDCLIVSAGARAALKQAVEVAEDVVHGTRRVVGISHR